MKIVIINTLYYPYKVGGAEVSVQLLAEALVKKGHSVNIISIHEKNTDEEDTLNGVKINYLSNGNIYWGLKGEKKTKLQKLAWHIIDTYNFKIKKKVDNLIGKIKPDVVHTNNLSGISVAVWSVAKKYNAKIVHTSRDYYLLHPNSKLYKKGQHMKISDSSVRFWSYSKRVMSRQVDSYIGISDFIRKVHVSAGFFPEAKVHTIYNSINYSDESVVKANLSRENKKRVGFIGRLTKEKGFDIFCALAQKNPDAMFIAAGEFDGNGKKLKELADNCNVKTLGYCPVDDFMSQVDIVVLPIRWHEPFGRVVVEAFAAGKIVLTTRVGGVSELAQILPNIYFLEDIGNINELPDKVEIKSDDLSVFNVNFVADKYLQAFSEVL
ncbi:glycosyltransferase family 4 protein [Pantoea phytobeneficialis]|uniref:Glycosyltransferase family 4 protein n=1 Tax=Pantoea phytobeneficialis TaxID=2052056 RepID=A0AAP9HA00_9GAMM|nr:glycosyltransferase family 4 protein [Pantoea phytobeneficialis]MDO6407406.1 glycosyltransferase family 4 protein [Pantoea phytobeneficialis]QGR09545.1 hypothetical protein CTZ24_24080 [Pantoea phytobeneficialis]